jgi:hypothetical protein
MCQPRFDHVEHRQGAGAISCPVCDGLIDIAQEIAKRSHKANPEQEHCDCWYEGKACCICGGKRQTPEENAAYVARIKNKWKLVR